MSTRIRVALLALSALLLLVGLLLVPILLPKPTDRLPGPGGYLFWAGVNYPWKSYQDFGTGAWGHSGVSAPGVNEEIDTDFANIAATGIQVVKWRIFNDGRYSPEFATDGSVTGLDDQFFKDFDAAIQIAQKHHVYLVIGLLDSGFWTAGCQRDGVQMGGHADVLTDPAKRQSFIDKAVVPLVEHAARTGRVISYELLAEPEWGITELHTEQDGRLTVPLADAQALVRDAAAAIHQHGGQLVTVEANRPSNMQYWRGLGLDYYSFSWYDWMEPYDPLDVPASSYGLDRPIVLGEYPIQNSTYYDPPQEMEIALGRGYAGAFGWSYNAGDKYGSLQNVADSYSRWLNSHWQLADLSSGTVRVPQSPTTLLPPPFSYQDVQVVPDGKGISAEVGIAVRQGGSFHVQFYLYPFDGKPGQPVADRTLVLQSGVQGVLRLRLADVTRGQTYRLSVAIFDDNWNLRKWFDSMSIFSVQEDGQIQYPSLSDLQQENPCAKTQG